MPPRRFICVTFNVTIPSRRKGYTYYGSKHETLFSIGIRKECRVFTGLRMTTPLAQSFLRAVGWAGR